MKYYFPTSAVVWLFSVIFLAFNVQTAEAKHALPFTEETWDKALENKSGNHIWVFTASDCTHCPAVLDQLLLQRKKHHLKFALTVVQTNDGNIKTPKNLQKTDAVYQFYGQKQRIEYSVNPKWHGVVPYVILMPKNGAIQYVFGAPSLENLLNLK